MLHGSKISSSNFRTLGAEELASVSGGYLNEDPISTGGAQIEYFRITGIWVNDAGEAGALLANVGGLGFDEGGGYVEGKDYCGTGWSEKLVPDVVAGIDISLACYTHDTDYGPDSTMDRVEADVKFAANIFTILVSHGMNPILATGYSTVYLTAVREYGRTAYEGQGSNF